MELKDQVNALAEELKNYAGTQAEIVKLTVVQKTSVILSAVTLRLILLFFLLNVSIFGGITLAELLKHYTGDAAGAYGLTTLLYLSLAGCCWFIFKKQISNRLTDAYIKTILRDEKHQ